jgi:hypothetical protein
MRYLAVAVALFASITGLWAAWLWLRASKVEVATGLPIMRPGDYVRAGIDLPGLGSSERAFRDAISGMNDDLMAALYALHQSSYLNKQAAIWTAVSVAASGLSAVIGSLG